jgi:adenylate cyclase
MADHSNRRRLVAVLFADMVGSTALAHSNEALALELLEVLRKVVRKSADAQGGKIIKNLGDGFLLTFESGLAAVRCGWAIQQALAERNRVENENKRFHVRIGVNLGDVEERDGDVFGNGVNLASRLMSTAIPGEVLLTQPVFDQLDPETRSLAVLRSERNIVNFPNPVITYRIAAPEGAPPPRPARKKRRVQWISAGAVTLAIVAAAAFWLDLHPGANADSRILLAVLPISESKPDAASAPLIEGLVETMSAELTRVAQYRAGLQVIPSSEVLSRKFATTADAAKFFRVNRILTCKLQRVDQTVRVWLTLEDPNLHQAIGSAIRDGLLTNVFVLQKELATEALGLLKLTAPASAPEAPRATRTENGEAYLAYLNGLGFLARFDKETDLRAAVEEFEKALKLDPGFALAHGGLAEACWRLFEREGDTRWKTRAEEEAALARSVDSPRIHSVLGLIAAGNGNPEQAVIEYQRAAVQNPASPDAQFGLARAYAESGRYAEAEQTYTKAIRQNPRYWAGYNALASYYLGRNLYTNAEANYLRAAEITPDNYLVACNLGGLYFYMDRREEARKSLNRSIELQPNADAFSNLGTLEFAENRYSNACQQFERAVQLGANEPTVWGNLADAWRQTGQSQAKIEATYERALEMTNIRLRIKPNDISRQIQAAYYLAHLGKTNEALETCEKARATTPEDLIVIYNAALVYERVGQRAKALEALRQAAKGGYSRQEIEGNPDLAGLRLDPQFAAIQNLTDAEQTNKQKKELNDP